MIKDFYDWILAASVFATALMTLYGFFAKPTSLLKKKATEQEEQRIKKILAETLPKILEQRDIDTRTKYLNDRQAYLEEIKNEVVQQVTSDFGGTINEIKDINVSQNEIIQVLARSSRDMLREKIMALYHKGKKTKSLLLWEREALDQYYIDYKAEEGNSYIDKYYNRMKTWSVIDQDEFEE